MDNALFWSVKRVQRRLGVHGAIAPVMDPVMDPVIYPVSGGPVSRCGKGAQRQPRGELRCTENAVTFRFSTVK
jgi:hypothetical protein